MQTITREELQAKMDRGDDFVLLETLPEPAYRRAHLSGAMQFGDFDKVPEVLPDKDTEVVVYCTNYT